MGRRDRVAHSTERYLKRTQMAEWKTALYARLSDENNGFEDDRSLQNQITYLEEYIDKQPDLALIDRHVDNGRSGMNFERPEFQRMIFSLKAGGLGLTAISNRLNQMGAPTPLEHKKALGRYANVGNGNKWSCKLLYRIIENRTYTGATIYNTLGKGEYKVIPNTHEALVDEEIFEAVNKEMAESGARKKEAMKKGSSRAEKYPNILQGIFYCGNCGHAMIYDRTGQTAVVRNFRYRCGGYNNYKKDDEGAPPCAVTVQSVSDHTVYKFVLDQIRVQRNPCELL